MKLIGNGAEANVYLDGTNNSVVKRRVQKTYRISEIDSKMRVHRTRREAKILKKLEGLCPLLLDVDERNGEIIMEHLEGPMVKEVVDDFSKDKRAELMNSIGSIVGKMHTLDVAHADLTTSNMIYLNGEVKLIDFGLSFVTDKIEHMAVDIHLFRQALESKHHMHYEMLYDNFLKGYSSGNSNSSEVFERLKKVEKRGRYKRKGEI